MDKHVRFNIETNPLYNSNTCDFSLDMDMTMVFVRIGQDLYEHPNALAHHDAFNDDLTSLTPTTTMPTIPQEINPFTWSNTCIKNIVDHGLRDTCIVMFQAITLSNMWQKFDMHSATQVKQIRGIMCKLGLTDINEDCMTTALDTMVQIKTNTIKGTN